MQRWATAWNKGSPWNKGANFCISVSFLSKFSFVFQSLSATNALLQAHPWFNGTQWDKLYQMEAAFKPEVTGELDTQNFEKFEEVTLCALDLYFFMPYWSHVQTMIKVLVWWFIVIRQTLLWFLKPPSITMCDVVMLGIAWNHFTTASENMKDI